MKKLSIFSMLYFCLSVTLIAQSKYITFQSKWDSGGGIAAYCWGHETTPKQINCFGNDNRTWAHLNLASRDFIDNDATHYGAKMIASNGFPTFTATLARLGFNLSDVTIKFSGVSLLQDIEGVDYFYSGTSETRFYKGGSYRILVRNVVIAKGAMPDLQDFINYGERDRCDDDTIKLQSNFTSAPTPVAGNQLGIDFVNDIGNRGIRFVFPALGRTAIRNDFSPNTCPNQVLRTGAFFECAEGKIIISDYPYNPINANVSVNNGGCTQLMNPVVSNNSSNWINFMHNGSIVASLLDEANMGRIQVGYKTIVNQPVQMNHTNNYWLDRDYTFLPERQPNKPVRLRLYFTATEWNRFINACNADNRPANDPQSMLDLLVTRVCKPNMCMDLVLNDIGTFMRVADAGNYNGTNYYVDVITNFLSNFTISYNRILDAGNNQVQNIVLPNRDPLINCTIGTAQQLSSASPNGVWSSSNVAVANFVNNNGTIKAISNGTTTITYGIVIPNTNNCRAETFAQYVVAAQAKPTIVAANNVSCTIGNNTVFTANIPNGIWMSSNPVVASVHTATPVTANVLARANGSTLIKYKVTNLQNCSDSSNVFIFTVARMAPPPAIVGANTVCANKTTLFSNQVVGGSWASDKVALATVNNNGLVSGVSAGNNVFISYTVRNNSGCSASVSKRINVLAIPAAPSIQPIVATNLLAVCSQNSVPLKAIPEGGTWSVTGTAAVSPQGVLSFKNRAVGRGTITYTTPQNANGCSNSITINVNSIACGNAPVVFAESQDLLTESMVNQVRVFPNPANSGGQLYVDLGKIEDRVAIVFSDISGKTIANFSTATNMVKLPLQNIQAGIYLLSINNGKQVVIKKVVIQ